MSLATRIGVSVLAASLVGAGAAAYFSSTPNAQAHTESSPNANCVACHMSEYRAAPHHEGEKPTACGVCHSQTAWQPNVLVHAWPLTGAHANGHCTWCHRQKPPAFDGTTRVCVGCHREDYDVAPGHPGHAPTTCGDCHTTTAWKPAEWNAPPEPQPTDTTPPPLPTITPTVTASVTASHPHPIPTHPHPHPSVVPSVKASVPDIITRPSRHED